MAISQPYTPNSSNTKWRKRGDPLKTGLNAGMHAEIKGYLNLGAEIEGLILFEQDAFPCNLCDTYFCGRPATQLIIFVVTGDGSGDRPTHVTNGLPVNAGYPCIIYYFGGAVTYNAAPPGAPAHPDPNNRN